MPRFLPAYHLRSPRDFERVYAAKQSAGNALLLVFGAKNQLEHSRVGLSVSRKHGGAVERNRWKRLFREAFRLTRTELPVGFDLILIPRSGAVPDLLALCESLRQLAKQVAKKANRRAAAGD